MHSSIPGKYYLYAIMTLAALLRLATLGHSAFRADTMDFYRYAASGTSPVYLLKNQPWENQIPMTEAYTVWFIKAFHLPITPWTVRFPTALPGILAVFFIYKLCLATFSQRMALTAAFLAAVNPFAVTISMEAYYYSGVICFAAMFFWTTSRLILKLQTADAGNKDWLLWAVSAALMCSTHMTTWSVFGGVWLFMATTAYHTADKQARTGTLVRLCLFAGLAATAIAPWLIKPVKTFVLGDSQPLGIEAAPWSNFLKILGETFPVYTFGKTLPGILLLSTIAIAGVAAAIKTKKTKPGNASSFFIMASFAFASNTALCIAMGKGHAKYVYFASLFPIVICTLVFFFDRITAWLSLRWNKADAKGLTVAALLCAISWAIPLQAVLTLEGKPTAYKTIADYINTHTEPGAIVLLDRWFEPWNELTLYPLKDGRQWTFTVPNEPAETAKQMKWHESVEFFFTKHPQAVYLPLLNSYTDPSAGAWFIGDWSWPEQHFANHVLLRHEAGIKLAKTGFAAREDFYDKNEGRLKVNLYFNKREDLLKKAEATGQRCLRLYGPGWNYVKLWQPPQNMDPRLIQTMWLQAGFYTETGKTIENMNLVSKMSREQIGALINRGRFADYLIPGGSTSLDLYNLTETSGKFTLRITGIAPGNTAVCRTAGQTMTFSSNLEEKTVFLSLEPGHTSLEFTQGRTSAPVLIFDTQLQPVETPEQITKK